MQQGQSSRNAWDHFDRMFQAIGRIEPDTPRRVALIPEILARINELLQERRTRLHTSQAEVPGTLWAVVALSTLLTMAVMSVLSPTRFNAWMVGVLACSFGLVFYFIIAMDRPFAGQESISSEVFQHAITSMQRWDAQMGAPGPVR